MAKEKKKMNYWQCQTKAFLASFRNIAKKDFLKSALFDLLTILSIIIIVGVCLAIVNKISADAVPQLLQVYELKQAGDEQAFNAAMAGYAPVLSRIMWISLITAVLGFLLSVFFLSWFYGKAWLYKLKKKFSSLFLRKYFILNLLWIIAWLIIIFATSYIFVTVAATIVVLVELLFFFYSDPVLRAVFDEKNNWKQNWSNFFRTARKAHWFVFFIIISIIIIILLLLIAGLLTKIPALFSIVMLIFVLFLIGWMRNYVSELVRLMKTD